MKVQRLSWAMLLFLAGVFAFAQNARRSHPSTGSLQSGSSQQVGESQPRNLYNACINSAERVENYAHAIMPTRLWIFDDKRDRHSLLRLHLAAEALWQNQAAFESSLTPEQVSMFDPEIHSVHQLNGEVEFRIQNVDHELHKHHPTKWRIAQDTSAIPKLVKEWKRRDQKIGRGSGVLQ